MSLVDTHAHVDYLKRSEHSMEDVMQEAKDNGVSWMVNPSVDLENMDEVLQLAEQYEHVYAAVAVHPTEVQHVKQEQWQEHIRAKLEHPKVVAIGETGLDYYHDVTHKALQQEFFRTFLGMAQETNLPVIVHDRDSHDDVYAMICDYPGVKGIMHCFSGDGAFAKKMMDCGFYISFAGNVTFKNAKNLHEAAQQVPLDRMLLETDSPFLSPVPFRGKPNQPARVRYVAEKVAELKGISVEEVAQVTSENAKKVFQLC